MSANVIEDLWPTDIAEPPKEKSPLIILREQAAKLNEKTSNIVEARVSVEPYIEQNLLFIRFNLKAPALGGYEYELLDMLQPADLYPVTLKFEDKYIETMSEADFKDQLELIFKSTRTRKIIGSLIAQSKSA